MKKLYLIIVIGVSIALSNSAQADSGGYLEVINKFFSLLASSKDKEASDVLFDLNPNSKISIEDRVKTELGLEDSQKKKGAFKKFVIASETKAGDGLVYVLVYGIYESGPVVFEFVFYKPDSVWFFSDLTCDYNVLPSLRQLPKIIPDNATLK